MRITGDGIWGEPPDRDVAKAVLRRAVELGVNFIDTADSYGPDVSESLIAEALHPYPEDLVIATKGGLERTGPGQWPANGRPEHLRDALRRQPAAAAAGPDPALPVPPARPEGAARGLDRRAGRAEGRRARSATSACPTSPRSSCARAQASHADRVGAEPLQRRPTAVRSRWSTCASRSSWRSCRGRRSSTSTRNPVVQEIADRHGATPRQIVLAWLLARSPAMLPIPGTGSVVAPRAQRRGRAHRVERRGSRRGPRRRLTGLWAQATSTAGAANCAL